MSISGFSGSDFDIYTTIEKIHDLAGQAKPAVRNYNELTKRVHHLALHLERLKPQERQRLTQDILALKGKLVPALEQRQELSTELTTLMRSLEITSEESEPEAHELDISNITWDPAMIPSLSPEELRSYFEIESTFREALAKPDVRNKLQYQKLYDQKILPMLREVKNYIKAMPTSYAVEAAAGKGKALQAGMQALKALVETPFMITKKTTSEQPVFLLPERGVVFKGATGRAKEEESLINAFFDIVAKRGVVGTFDFRQVSAERFGMRLAEEIEARGFSSSAIVPKLKQAIVRSLDSKEKKALQACEKAKLAYTLTPDLRDPKRKKSYEICNEVKWRFTDATGKIRECDFKTLQSEILLGKKVDPTPLRSSLKSAMPTQSDLKTALAIPWLVASLQLMKATESTVSALTHIQAKPFIQDMVLFNDLQARPKAFEHVFSRLTPDAEYHATCTGEFQLLDLHGGNIALAPEPTPEYERYKEQIFHLPPAKGALSIKDILLKYLDGEITDTTQVAINGVVKPMGKWQDLQKALDVHWKFVIFDTDVSLAEDNRLQLMIVGKQKEHHIPLRSCFFETPWQDAPLHPETLGRLLESEERDAHVLAWAQKMDAPIYRLLSDAAKKRLALLLAPHLQRYSLSEYRADRKGKTVAKLQSDFVQDIEGNKKVWSMLEQELSQGSVYPGDTWQTIAHRHHQSIDDLKALNPGINLKTAQRVSTRYDLTSNTDVAKKRRSQIANQLFPRMTIRQQEALKERQMRKREYCQAYKRLSEVSAKGAALAREIKNFLACNALPLDSVRKEELQKLIEQLPANKLAELKKSLCDECRPSYANIMKAMYPLLADVHILAKKVYGDVKGGETIGQFGDSLEVLIAKVKKEQSKDPKLQKLAIQLEQRIQAIHDPSFSGYFW